MGLPESQERGLLAWPAASTYHKYKTGERRPAITKL